MSAAVKHDPMFDIIRDEIEQMANGYDLAIEAERVEFVGEASQLIHLQSYTNPSERVSLFIVVLNCCGGTGAADYVAANRTTMEQAYASNLAACFPIIIRALYLLVEQVDGSCGD